MRLWTLLLLFAAGGCASLGAPPPVADDCAALQRALADAAGGSPSSPRPLPGFPGLAADRFLAAFDPPALAAPAQAAWLGRLAAAGAELDARRAARVAADVGPPLAPLSTLPGRLSVCRATTLAGVPDTPDGLARVHAAAQVPSEYRGGARVAGLWPLTVLPVLATLHGYQRDTLARFAAPPPARGERLRYRPPAASLTKLAPARDALGVPAPTPAQWTVLFARHAPVFEVDTASADDLPGRPLRGAAGRPTVAPEPVVYRWGGYAFWQGRPVLQLDYLIWFAARPAEAGGALYAGALDGVIWRVTLDADGAVLAYDSIHACGCYHVLFPRPGLRLRAAAAALAEAPLLPYPAPPLAAGQRVVVRLGAGHHYLEAVTAGDASGTPYRLADDAELYAARGAASLFDADGLVAGSERPERWLLWPMGVPSAGTMRERGRHAIAFVGERHFDDPTLLDAWLEPAPAAP
ncbi:hypothetical protein EV699_10880 [Plasticicumulans lactativorans]|uniref:Uncharacterized protein n=1 Tax=Plasticicumulans lactativorans TaxID=1133106 RepID=A0A4R2LAT3_9GAMM|nr:hypothetical protein [Plasticicumulans lactativorans]TCO81449.1 hypothetical protein EV699_10880 [Plasticicumulans lactativorans]